MRDGSLLARARWFVFVAFVLLVHDLANAQPAPQAARVGIVFYRIPAASLTGPEIFTGAKILRDRLSDLGWEEGRNLEILWRTAEGDGERVPGIVRELVEKKVDVIAVSGDNLIEAAMRTTKDIPIVMLVSFAPVDAGFVASASRPGGNVTGIMQVPQSQLTGKRLEILKQAAPNISRVAFLHDGHNLTGIDAGVEAAARRLGVTLMPYPVDNEAQLNDAMRDAVRRGANAVFVNASYGAVPKEQPALAALIRKHRLPAMFRLGNAVYNGAGLMTYSPHPVEEYRRAMTFVDRILRGEKPATMPLEQANKYELVINLKMAREIGLVIPASLLTQADKLIQ